MKNKFKIFILIFSLIMVFTVNYRAAAEREIKAEDITVNSLEEGEEIIAEADVYILYNSLEFTGGYARLNSDSGEIFMEDNLRIESQNYTLRGETLEGNLNEEEFEITESVEIIGEELEAKASRMTYNHRNREAFMEDNLTLKYQDLDAEADEGDFDLEEEKVVLRGKVKGEQNGREFSAETVRLTMEDGEVNMQGGARLMIPDEDGEGEE